jgi:hypothetical protein
MIIEKGNKDPFYIISWKPCSFKDGDTIHFFIYHVQKML